MGAFLSGGVDSAGIVALASEYVSELQTFTIRFHEAEFDEGLFARRVAGRYGTRHREFFVASGDMPPLIDCIVEQYEEPYADPSALPSFILAQKASQYVKVALNGDGGDENFAGYDKYRRHAIADRIARFVPFPQTFARAVLAAYRWRPALTLYKLHIFLRTLGLSAVERHYYYTHYFEPFSKHALLSDEFCARLTSQKNAFVRATEGHDARGIDEIFSLDIRTYLPDDLLVKVDIATMSHGLEGRSPLLDREVVEFAATLPYEYKYHADSGGKYIWKTLLAPYLPHDLLYRKKTGFGIPIDAWL